MTLLEQNWHDIGAETDIPLRGARCVKIEGRTLAIFRTMDGSLFAIDDACPHKKGPLRDGIVHGHAVTCPLHNWVINLETGEAQGEDHGKTATYQTRLQQGRLQIYLPKPTGQEMRAAG